MPKQFFKVAGKKIPFGEATGDWKLESRPGGWIIATRGDERVRFQALETRGKLGLAIRGRLYQGEIAQAERAGAGGGSDADLTAQFPGKVRKIVAAEGAKVTEGETLLFIEAMKMEFAIKSPKSGKLTKLLVKEGQQLAAGDRLAEVT